MIRARVPSPHSDAWREQLLAAGGVDVLNPEVRAASEEAGAPSRALAASNKCAVT
jgi:hypothetical protein